MAWGIRLIVSDQEDEPFDHVVQGDQDTSKQSHERETYKLFDTCFLQKLGLFLHCSNHDDQINNDHKNRHCYHKLIKF